MSVNELAEDVEKLAVAVARIVELEVFHHGSLLFVQDDKVSVALAHICAQVKRLHLISSFSV